MASHDSAERSRASLNIWIVKKWIRRNLFRWFLLVGICTVLGYQIFALYDQYVNTLSVNIQIRDGTNTNRGGGGGRGGGAGGGGEPSDRGDGTGEGRPEAGGDWGQSAGAAGSHRRGNDYDLPALTVCLPWRLSLVPRRLETILPEGRDSPLVQDIRNRHKIVPQATEAATQESLGGPEETTTSEEISPTPAVPAGGGGGGSEYSEDDDDEYEGGLLWEKFPANVSVSDLVATTLDDSAIRVTVQNRAGGHLLSRRVEPNRVQYFSQYGKCFTFFTRLTEDFHLAKIGKRSSSSSAAAAAAAGGSSEPLIMSATNQWERQEPYVVEDLSQIRVSIDFRRIFTWRELAEDLYWRIPVTLWMTSPYENLNSSFLIGGPQLRIRMDSAEELNRFGAVSYTDIIFVRPEIRGEYSSYPTSRVSPAAWTRWRRWWANSGHGHSPDDDGPGPGPEDPEDEMKVYSHVDCLHKMVMAHLRTRESCVPLNVLLQTDEEIRTTMSGWRRCGGRELTNNTANVLVNGLPRELLLAACPFDRRRIEYRGLQYLPRSAEARILNNTLRRHRYVATVRIAPEKSISQWTIRYEYKMSTIELLASVFGLTGTWLGLSIFTVFLRLEDLLRRLLKRKKELSGGLRTPIGLVSASTIRSSTRVMTTMAAASATTTAASSGQVSKEDKKIPTYALKYAGTPSHYVEPKHFRRLHVTFGSSDKRK